MSNNEKKNTKLSDVTGFLKDWNIQQVSKKEFIVWGNVFDDVMERFPDGMRIHTSGIKNRPLKEGDIVTTRNSKYLLGKPLKSCI